jgi:hypothetical protein
MGSRGRLDFVERRPGLVLRHLVRPARSQSLKETISNVSELFRGHLQICAPRGLLSTSVLQRRAKLWSAASIRLTENVDPGRRTRTASWQPPGN